MLGNAKNVKECNDIQCIVIYVKTFCRDKHTPTRVPTHACACTHTHTSVGYGSRQVKHGTENLFLRAYPAGRLVRQPCYVRRPARRREVPRWPPENRNAARGCATRPWAGSQRTDFAMTCVGSQGSRPVYGAQDGDSGPEGERETSPGSSSNVSKKA